VLNTGKEPLHQTEYTRPEMLDNNI